MFVTNPTVVMWQNQNNVKDWGSICSNESAYSFKAQLDNPK